MNGMPAASVHLYWVPLGAGDNTHCVRTNGRIFEWMQATFERRSRCDLYHSALVVRIDDVEFAIEMGPSWGNSVSERGVVGEGPVGLPSLGRWKFFRYEVRCCREGVIPDALDAVGGPVQLDSDLQHARKLIDLVPEFPTVTWGRDELRTGDMWNSNTLTSWLLAGSGHDNRSGDDATPRSRAGLVGRPASRVATCNADPYEPARERRQEAIATAVRK